MAIIREFFKIGYMFKTSCRNGIGKLCNAFGYQGTIYNFHIAVIPVAAGQHQVNPGMRTDFDFPLDNVISGQLWNPFLSNRFVDQPIRDQGVDTHQ